MTDKYINPLKLLTTVTALFHDTSTIPNNNNINDKAQKLINTILDNIEDLTNTIEDIKSSLHDLSIILFLLTKSEQERLDILDQCAFLKVNGGNHDY